MLFFLCLVVFLGVFVAQPFDPQPPGTFAYRGALWRSDWAALSEAARTVYGQPCNPLATYSYRTTAPYGQVLNWVLHRIRRDKLRVVRRTVRVGVLAAERLVIEGPTRTLMEIFPQGRVTRVRWCQVVRRDL